MAATQCDNNLADALGAAYSQFVNDGDRQQLNDNITRSRENYAACLVQNGYDAQAAIAQAVAKTVETLAGSSTDIVRAMASDAMDEVVALGEVGVSVLGDLYGDAYDSIESLTSAGSDTLGDISTAAIESIVTLSGEAAQSVGQLRVDVADTISEMLDDVSGTYELLRVQALDAITQIQSANQASVDAIRQFQLQALAYAVDYFVEGASSLTSKIGSVLEDTIAHAETLTQSVIAGADKTAESIDRLLPVLEQIAESNRFGFADLLIQMFGPKQ